jgi:hypothetical protein
MLERKDKALSGQMGRIEYALEGINTEFKKEYVCPYYIREKLRIIEQNLKVAENIKKSD